EPAVVPTGVETEDLPMRAEETEEARRRVPGCEARIRERYVVVAVAPRVHVVVCIERPRSDALRFGGLHRPIRQKPLFILVTPPRVVHVPQLDDVDRPA